MEVTCRRAVSRALAVLAVLSGLLAMHGLATGHHASAHASGPTAAHAGTAVAAAHHDGAATHHAAASVTHVPAAERLLTLSPADDCDPACPVGAAASALCLAVLSGLALALHLTRARRAALLPRRRGVACRPRAPGAALRRCPDPVSELCISRT